MPCLPSWRFWSRAPATVRHNFLDILRTEIWPLLADRSPITKLEREQILGYDPATGV